MTINIDYEEMTQMSTEKIQLIVNDAKTLMKKFPFSEVRVERLPSKFMANGKEIIMETYLETDPESGDVVQCFWYNQSFFDGMNLVFNA